MDQKRIETIIMELSEEETDSLVEDLQIHDTEAWTEEAFEAMRQILLARLGSVPPVDDVEESDRLLAEVERQLGEGQMEEALETCGRAIQAAPHSPEPHNVRGMILDDLERIEEAIEAFQEAVRLWPEYQDARDNLKYANEEGLKKSIVTQVQSASIETIGFEENIFRAAWNLVWNHKIILVCSFLYAVIIHGITVVEALFRLNIVRFVNDLVDIIAISLYYGGMIRLIDNFLCCYSFTPYDIWSSARKSFKRLLALQMLIACGVGVMFLIGAFLAFIGPILLYVVILSTVVCVLIAAYYFPLLEVMLVISSEPFFKGIAKTVKLLSGENLRMVTQVTLSYYGMSLWVSALAFCFVVATKPGIFQGDLFLVMSNVAQSMNPPLIRWVNFVNSILVNAYGLSLIVVLYRRMTYRLPKSQAEAVSAPEI